MKPCLTRVLHVWPECWVHASLREMWSTNCSHAVLEQELLQNPLLHNVLVNIIAKHCSGVWKTSIFDGSFSGAAGQLSMTAQLKELSCYLEPSYIIGGLGSGKLSNPLTRFSFHSYATSNSNEKCWPALRASQVYIEGEVLTVNMGTL